ncbi:MAG: methylmalonyl-CoA epimerase, partial [Candidatus Rokubacteria bacterium]|nr:methylmalonyl-CoA epimerase [Candidatus Rokubacteria bacterium]
MKLLRINHLGIASPSLSETMASLQRIFGLTAGHIEEVPDQKVRTAF